MKYSSCDLAGSYLIHRNNRTHSREFYQLTTNPMKYRTTAMDSFAMQKRLKFAHRPPLKSIDVVVCGGTH